MSRESPAILAPKIEETTLSVLMSQMLTFICKTGYILVPPPGDQDVRLVFLEPTIKSLSPELELKIPNSRQGYLQEKMRLL